MISHGLSILWFIAIVVAIPFVLWLLKRSPYGRALGSGGGGLVQVIDSQALSPSQRVVVVEVGSGEQRQWLVLGVTPQQITALQTLPPQELPPALSRRVAGPFVRRLREAQQRMN